MRDKVQQVAVAAANPQLPNYAFGTGVLIGGSGIWLIDLLGFDGTASFLTAVGLMGIGAMTVNQYGVNRSVQAVTGLGSSLWSTANSYLHPAKAPKAPAEAATAEAAPVAKKTM